MFASLRRTLSSGPGLLMPRRGHIDGIVFRDDQVQGIYTPGLPPLAGVEIVLDNVRYTRTDSSGRFRFDDVAYGRHRVEARYVSDQPTFFTTPSPAEVDAGASVHFGIALSRSSLRGVVLTDAGIGLSGVLVHIVSADRRTTVRTADDGTFVGEGLLGRRLRRHASRRARFRPDTRSTRSRLSAFASRKTVPGRATFVLRPFRSVAGRARCSIARPANTSRWLEPPWSCSRFSGSP